MGSECLPLHAGLTVSSKVVLRKTEEKLTRQCPNLLWVMVVLRLLD